MLEVKALSKNFGGLKAVSNVSFKVDRGKITALIGPNGAGKTTCFSMISGFELPTKGEILFESNNIVGRRPDQLCKLGIVRTFQITEPFSTLTTLENIMIGAMNNSSLSMNLVREKALSILEEIELIDKKDVLAADLSMAEQKKLEIARALATQPKLLLLDEVLAGLTPAEVEKMIPFLHSLKEKGITILMIEHIMQAVMKLSDFVIVLHHGQKLKEGKPFEVASDPEVIKAYLGEEIYA